MTRYIMLNSDEAGNVERLLYARAALSLAKRANRDDNIILLRTGESGVAPILLSNGFCVRYKRD